MSLIFRCTHLYKGIFLLQDFATLYNITLYNEIYNITNNRWYFCNITYYVITNWNLYSSTLPWFLNPGISIPPLIINYLTHLVSWIFIFLECLFLPLYFHYNYTFIFLLLLSSLTLLVHYTFSFVLSIQFHKTFISVKSIYLHII